MNDALPHVNIEAAHLLPRSTKRDMLTKLKFAFGLRFRQLHIDTTRNLVYLKVDQHRSFDHTGFFLLPSWDVILAIESFMAAPKGRTYKQVFTRQTFEYRMVPLQLSKDGNGIFRLRLSEPSTDDSDLGAVYDQIFPLTNHTALPIISSHANPFFVIANAGPKLESHLDLVPPALQSDQEISGDIARILTLWVRWSHARPTEAWMAARYNRRDRSGNRKGGSVGHGGGGPSSAHHDGSPTPSRRAHSNPSNSGAGPSGHGLARTAAGPPELDRNDYSDGIESDVLTEDAVRSVVYLDRTAFLQKWLDGDHSWANTPGIEMEQ
ncbi:hypothetical protein B0H11DRAFT_894882 [Mycena galericulata]|nr:hypothetical protein B0H11DRAFT_894882 [Mycena galericulata]